MEKRRALLIITGAVIFILGAASIIGGAWLAYLGGSWFYVLCGLGLSITAFLIAKGKSSALLIYTLVVLGTLLWSLYEIGLDWWPLAIRGDIIFVIGIWLVTPWIRRRISDRVWDNNSKALAFSLLVAGIVGIFSVLGDYHDKAGELAMKKSPGNDQYGQAEEWSAYGQSNSGIRYSSLAEITPKNVNKLKIAWTYHTGDRNRTGDPKESTFEVTPIKADNRLYLCTPHSEVISLDADTGKEIWRFDPEVNTKGNFQHMTCRGVSYYSAASYGKNPSGQCSKRIFIPTADARLFALDAATGKQCAGFGNKGEIDLWKNMPNVQLGFYYSTSPPVVTRDLVIIAGNITDNYSTTEPSGVIRAFDINSGKLVWNFDSGNPASTSPLKEGQTYTANSPNSWGVSSADEKLGLIYLPMGNSPPDQYGANRSANTEKYSSLILALDIKTGKPRWVFQTTHHDLWDMDIGAQPSLVDLDIKGTKMPALVAPTKQGDIYVLNRTTGQPIIPVEEKPVPQGAAPGDHTSPTQPFSALTFQPDRQLKESDMWGATMFDQLACRIMFKENRYEGIYTPPSLKGSIVYPGNFGVFDWGGIAVDPVNQIAFANPDYFAFYSRLIPQKEAEQSKRKNVQSPAGGSDIKKGEDESGVNPNYGAPYAVDLAPFVSPIGLPCQSPPWGYIAGIDLRSGQIVYKHKNGTVRDLAPVPLPFKMGVPSLGGPIITAGGVAFLTGTLDYYIRAYDVLNGKEIWKDRLPAGGQATPMTYRAADGRQIVIAVAGGHGSLGTKQGDYIIAYSLDKGAK